MFENKTIHSENFYKLDENNFYLLRYFFETAYLIS